ncbi:hypothetical protein [Streptomyces sp. NBC_01500]|uniref:hypothetical protein n=1 Tax=Streptomyces sp. NBC_01500 TaxID=2903886 RepID=UPI002253D40D|nr:hypothetical protein [Streptomyces sp. NBC_01500]MCX4554124.1 hypothetical protein [Streptomyces sp. NBC_01500]
MTSLPTDSVMIRLFHLGEPYKEIARQYGVSPQAVSKRMLGLGLERLPAANQASELLNYRWGSILTSQYGKSHHSHRAGKSLKVWLRARLGDDGLSDLQRETAAQWESRIRKKDQVLCYDRASIAGWSYRDRTPEDGRLVIDWPKDLPFPDGASRSLLELPDPPP